MYSIENKGNEVDSIMYRGKPIHKAYKGESLIYDDLKNHILAWYSPQLEGCTNESLAVDKKLTDLSGNGYDLDLKNFTFGGLNSLGSYNNVFSNGMINYRWPVDNYGYKIVLNSRMANTSNSSTFMLVEPYKNKKITLRVKNLEQLIDRYPAAWLKLGNTNNIVKDGVYKYTPNNYISIVNLPDADTIDLGGIIVEEIPTYENALVFNRNTPTWVYSKDNLMSFPPNSSYLNNTTLNITKLLTDSSTFYSMSAVSASEGTSLAINVPSYKIRISGLSGNQKMVISRVLNNGKIDLSHSSFLEAKNGTYIIPAYNTTIEPANNKSTPVFKDFRVHIQNVTVADAATPSNITIEFLPTYAAPVTNMYGLINTIPPNTVKCMMMDFVPFSDATERFYYSQRTGDSGDNFAILNSSIYNVNTGNIIGYSIENANGTYINGELNTTQTVLNLLQKRQVVAVNTDDNNQYNNIIVCSAPIVGRFGQMALYSLILFDRELTPKEMKYVMKKLMKFRETTYNYEFINSSSIVTEVGFTPGGGWGMNPGEGGLIDSGDAD